MPKKSPARPRYEPHPALSRERAPCGRVEEETGRPFAAWLETARTRGPGDAKACAEWLRAEHGVSAENARRIAAYAAAGVDPADYEEPEGLVDALYSGPREPLRALHEKLVDVFRALGDDVVVTACKTMVPVYRKFAFAQLRPADGGVEIALSLGDTPTAGRLAERARAMGDDRIGHRVLVRSAKEIDAELRGWIAQAYEAGAARAKRATSAEAPADLTKALRASKTAAATWATCTPAMQRDFIVWITSAKQDATRARRVAQAVEKLAAGKRRAY